MKLYLWLSRRPGRQLYDNEEWSLNDAKAERACQIEDGCSIGPLKVVTLIAPPRKRKAKK